MNARRRWTAGVVVLAGIGTVLLAGCGQRGGEPPAPPPPEVVFATAEKGNLPLDLAYTGRAVGSREVEVRALVSGILLERRYEEGKPVRRGEVLFLIDPDRYSGSRDNLGIFGQWIAFREVLKLKTSLPHEAGRTNRTGSPTTAGMFQETSPSPLWKMRLK